MNYVHYSMRIHVKYIQLMQGVNAALRRAAVGEEEEGNKSACT